MLSFRKLLALLAFAGGLLVNQASLNAMEANDDQAEHATEATAEESMPEIIPVLETQRPENQQLGQLVLAARERKRRPQASTTEAANIEVGEVKIELVSKLPAEIWDKIFEYLSPSDAMRFAGASSTCKSLVRGFVNRQAGTSRNESWVRKPFFNARLLNQFTQANQDQLLQPLATPVYRMAHGQIPLDHENGDQNLLDPQYVNDEMSYTIATCCNTTSLRVSEDCLKDSLEVNQLMRSDALAQLMSWLPLNLRLLTFKNVSFLGDEHLAAAFDLCEKLERISMLECPSLVSPCIERESMDSIVFKECSALRSPKIIVSNCRLLRFDNCPKLERDIDLRIPNLQQLEVLMSIDNFSRGWRDRYSEAKRSLTNIFSALPTNNTIEKLYLSGDTWIHEWLVDETEGKSCANIEFIFRQCPNLQILELNSWWHTPKGKLDQKIKEHFPRAQVRTSDERKIVDTSNRMRRIYTSVFTLNRQDLDTQQN